jgi:hypothetical protein
MCGAGYLPLAAITLIGLWQTITRKIPAAAAEETPLECALPPAAFGENCVANSAAVIAAFIDGDDALTDDLRLCFEPGDASEARCSSRTINEITSPLFVPKKQTSSGLCPGAIAAHDTAQHVTLSEASYSCPSSCASLSS